MYAAQSETMFFALRCICFALTLPRICCNLHTFTLCKLGGGSAIKTKVLRLSFCIALALHTFTLCKLGGGSAIKTKVLRLSFCIALALH